MTERFEFAIEVSTCQVSSVLPSSTMMISDELAHQLAPIIALASNSRLEADLKVGIITEIFI